MLYNIDINIKGEKRKMDIYKRIMLYVNCVADVQQYLTKHVLEIPAGTLQDLNAIFIKLLDQLKKDE